MKSNSMRSLTEGPIVRTLMSLALPIMASSFLTTAYNITDMAWVGMLGAKAVAGVGVGGMLLWFSQGIACLPRMGGQVFTAQAIGARKMDNARKYARASLQMVVVFALLFAFVCLAFTPQIVGFLKVQETVSRQIGIEYIRITCGFIIFSFLNVTLTGLYTAMGDSRTPLIANFFGLVMNMILDPLLILGVGFFPRLESTGAAIATVFSQAIVLAILMIRIIRNTDEQHLLKKQEYFHPVSTSYYIRIAKMGIPASLQSLVYCFMSMILTRLISGFGAEAIAVMRVGGQIESVSWNTAEGFGSALNAFCGQNYGAGKFDRIRKGYQFSVLSGFIWGALVMICFLLVPGTLSSFFFHEPLAMAISISYLIIIGYSEPFMTVELVTVGGLSGLGRTQLCSTISIILTGMRIPIAYVLEKTSLGLDGVWWAISLTSIAKGIVFTVVFLWIIRNKEKRSIS